MVKWSAMKGIRYFKDNREDMERSADSITGEDPPREFQQCVGGMTDRNVTLQLRRFLQGSAALPTPIAHRPDLTLITGRVSDVTLSYRRSNFIFWTHGFLFLESFSVGIPPIETVISGLAVHSLVQGDHLNVVLY
jgi:hypothetical protein